MAQELQHLVDQVKGLQRSDPGAKELWCAWCDANAEGTKDPGRLSPEMINAFFAAYNEGSITPSTRRSRAPRAPEQHARAERHAPGLSNRFAQEVELEPYGQSPDLAQAIKVGQRFSPSWKTAWKGYCTFSGVNTLDPMKHSQEFLVAFFELLGSQACETFGTEVQAAPAPLSAPARRHSSPAMASSNGSFRSGAIGAGVAPARGASFQGGPPLKRPRTEHPAASAPSMSLHAPGSEGEHLVMTIKDLQKNDHGTRAKWVEFCDLHGKGTKDPSRHDVQTLQLFFEFAENKPVNF